MGHDNRGRLIAETRTKTSVYPTEIEYNIEYEYDQLGNRTARYDLVAERRTDYTYDTDFAPKDMDFSTRDNVTVHPSAMAGRGSGGRRLVWR